MFVAAEIHHFLVDGKEVAFGLNLQRVPFLTIVGDFTQDLLKVQRHVGSEEVQIKVNQRPCFFSRELRFNRNVQSLQFVLKGFPGLKLFFGQIKNTLQQLLAQVNADGIEVVFLLPFFFGQAFAGTKIDFAERFGRNFSFQLKRSEERRVGKE